MIRRQRHFEAACLAEFDPPITLLRPKTLLAPVVFCSPHSGRHYPADFIARSDQPLSSLRRNEDAFVDALFGLAPALGAPLLSARFPRSFLDVNRAENELPQSWLPRGAETTIRAEAGLGVVPTVLGEGRPIYRRPLRPSAVAARLERLYVPYHTALKGLLGESVAEFGKTLLVDCHSMPGFAPSGARRSDIILGDRYGTSCYPETLARIESLFTARGLTVTRNHPYAGSFVTSHYGQPHDGVEAVQIEINRDLYLNPITLKPKAGYDKLRGDISGIIEDIIQGLRPEALIAAE